MLAKCLYTCAYISRRYTHGHTHGMLHARDPPKVPSVQSDYVSGVPSPLKSIYGPSVAARNSRRISSNLRSTGVHAATESKEISVLVEQNTARLTVYFWIVTKIALDCFVSRGRSVASRIDICFSYVDTWFSGVFLLLAFG